MSNNGTSVRDFYDANGNFDIFNEKTYSRPLSANKSNQPTIRSYSFLQTDGGSCFRNTNNSSFFPSTEHYRCCASTSILTSSRTGLSP